MSENKQIFILVFMGLLLAILMFGAILSENILRERNLKLYEHILEDCQIDYDEYQALEKF